MRSHPPTTVWISVLLLLSTLVALTWQTIYVFGSQPIAADNPDALTRQGLAMGFFLAVIWLLQGVPAVIMLWGSRACRWIVTLAALPGLVAVAVYRQPTAWGPLLLGLKATQLFAILLLYVGPSRAFFRR